MSKKREKPTAKCLQCNKTTGLRRGLCPAHYNAFLRRKRTAEAEGYDPEEYDRAVVESGQILADGRTLASQANDVFFEILLKFKAAKNVERNLGMSVQEEDGEFTGTKKTD